MTQGYLIFHLNLAFSSIPSESRLEVIRKCYWPLLDLAEEAANMARHSILLQASASMVSQANGNRDIALMLLS